MSIRRKFLAGFGLAMVLCTTSVRGLERGAESRSDPVLELMRQPPEGFAARSELDCVLDATALDVPLLSAAIFHETNRVRRELGLAALKSLAALNDAAEIEARVGGALMPPEHENPFASIHSPVARLNHVGLRPEKAAENIASLLAYDIEGGAEVGVAKTGGRSLFLNLRTNEPLRLTTYRRFARLIVQAWLNSTTHRANLLGADYRYLGCSVRAGRTIFGAPTVFGVQEFFTPRGEGERPRGPVGKPAPADAAAWQSVLN